MHNLFQERTNGLYWYSKFYFYRHKCLELRLAIAGYMNTLQYEQQVKASCKQPIVNTHDVSLVLWLANL